MKLKCGIGVALIIAVLPLLAEPTQNLPERSTLAGAGFAIQTSSDGKALKIYIGDQDTVLCMNTQTGQTLWSTRTPYGTVDVGPVLEDGILAYIGGGGHFAIYALDPATGHQEWTREHRASLIVAGNGKLFVNTQSGLGIAAFDLKTGYERWSFSNKPGGSLDRLFYSSGKIYTTDYTLSAATGHLLSRSKAAVRAITANDNAVFIADANDDVFAITRQSRKLRWKVQVGKKQEIAGIARTESKVFVALYDGYPDSANTGIIRGYTADKGLALWEQKLDARARSLLWHPIAADTNNLYVLMPGGRENETILDAWSVESGKKKWTYSNAGGIVGPIVIVDREIYANDACGHVYVIDADSGLLLRTLSYRSH